MLPHIRGVLEQIRKVFKQYDAYFKPMYTVCQLLVRPKDKMLKERVMRRVFYIPCDRVMSPI